MNSIDVVQSFFISQAGCGCDIPCSAFDFFIDNLILLYRYKIIHYTTYENQNQRTRIRATLLT